MADVKIEPFFGGFVLETLTVGMYGESRNAIREYIQNGFDSIQKARKAGQLDEDAGLIEIIMSADGDGLVIRDDGAGLSVNKAAGTLTSVGASTKDPHSSAGFRGIGRLAGIGFCDLLTFTTKASGEKLATTIRFDGKLMREQMSPDNGSRISAEELLKLCVSGSTDAYPHADDHFFEVKLEGFVDAPEECTNGKLMEEFVSQVAPVKYHRSFPFLKKLQAQAKASGIPIETVQITIDDGVNDVLDVTKGYRKTYQIESGSVELADCDIWTAADGKSWWAWVGKKNASGSYTDARVSGLRVRMKNIQIDGTDVVREIFRRRAKSFIRFQDWSVGEIFVRPSYLVPNARRDGFEETKAWKAMRIELTDLVKDMGEDSYRISDAGQIAVGALAEKVKATQEDLERLRRAEFKNVDKVLTMASDITKLQKKIATASHNAGLSTLAELQALGSELLDIKSEAISKIAPPPLDIEDIRQETTDELLRDLLILFEEELDPRCFTKVRTVLRATYGI